MKQYHLFLASKDYYDCHLRFEQSCTTLEEALDIAIKEGALHAEIMQADSDGGLMPTYETGGYGYGISESTRWEQCKK